MITYTFLQLINKTLHLNLYHAILILHVWTDKYDTTETFFFK